MTVKRVTLRNFQKHRKKEIDLDEKLTVIIGPNDCGKSALLRGIRWCCLNRPGTTGLKRQGNKRTTTSIKLQLRNKLRSTTYDNVTRSIGHGGNLYSINGKKLKAVGTTVPDEVRRLLRVDEINFQDQHHPLFWFDLSPGQVAKQLNKLIDLDAIDRTQDEVAKLLRDKKAELRVCNSRIKELRHELTTLRWVKRADHQFGGIQLRHNDIASKSHKMARICNAVGVAVGQRTRLAIVSQLTPTGSAAMAVGRRGVAVGRVAVRLLAVIGRADEARQLVRPIPSTVSLDRLATRIETNKEQLSKLRSLVHKTRKQETCICQLSQEIEVKQNLIEKKLGGRCPTCGGILTDKMILS